jgi:ketosteroid isomerase-like protein
MLVRPDVSTILDRFTDAFNRNDLDTVMTYFADDAVYEPGDGSSHRGRAAIREAFAPQFSGAYGAMRFDLEDRLVDEPNRKAVLRWICRHDLAGGKVRGMPIWLRVYLRARFGTRVGWRGLDVFHLDESGKIVAKYTYANYDRPQLRRELG